MRHGLKKTARLAGITLGVLLLAWIPLSYFFIITGGSPLPGIVGAQLTSVHGVAELTIIRSAPNDSSLATVNPSLDIDRVSTIRSQAPPSTATEMLLKPESFQFNHLSARMYDIITVAVPIWMIAISLLLWPMLSWCLHFHRSRRAALINACPTESANVCKS